MQAPTNFIGIDLFSGAGGMSIGAIAAGINVAVAIEYNHAAAETYSVNHPSTRVIVDDIRNLDPLSYSEKYPFIVFGGPPCQGFSHSNRQTRNETNENNHLFLEFCEVIEKLEPTWFVFENVAGIVDFNKGKTLDDILFIFQETLGYTISQNVLWASDYGVPQSRNRFFIVGNKNGTKYSFPKALPYKVTVDEAIRDLPSLHNGEKHFTLPYKKDIILSDYIKKIRAGSEYATQNFVSCNQEYVIERYKYIEQGQNWEAIPAFLMTNYADRKRCHSGIYKRLSANKPSVVVSNYRKNMLIHPFENRGLSVREAARLQSFPDTFIFQGALMHQQQQIGNAVPPLLAEAIFKEIISQS